MRLIVTIVMMVVTAANTKFLPIHLNSIRQQVQDKINDCKYQLSTFEGRTLAGSIQGKINNLTNYQTVFSQDIQALKNELIKLEEQLQREKQQANADPVGDILKKIGQKEHELTYLYKYYANGSSVHEQDTVILPSLGKRTLESLGIRSILLNQLDETLLNYFLYRVLEFPQVHPRYGQINKTSPNWQKNHAGVYAHIAAAFLIRDFKESAREEWRVLEELHFILNKFDKIEFNIDHHHYPLKRLKADWATLESLTEASQSDFDVSLILKILNQYHPNRNNEDFMATAQKVFTILLKQTQFGILELALNSLEFRYDDFCSQTPRLTPTERFVEMRDVIESNNPARFLAFYLETFYRILGAHINAEMLSLAIQDIEHENYPEPKKRIHVELI